MKKVTYPTLNLKATGKRYLPIFVIFLEKNKVDVLK